MKQKLPRRGDKMVVPVGAVVWQRGANPEFWTNRHRRIIEVSEVRFPDHFATMYADVVVGWKTKRGKFQKACLGDLERASPVDELAALGWKAS